LDARKRKRVSPAQGEVTDEKDASATASIWPRGRPKGTLGVENRCVVLFNSFCKFNKAKGDDIWFDLDETRPSAALPASGQLHLRPEGKGG